MGLLYADEFRGFARSKVMVVLWIGLPLLTVLFRLLQPDTENVPLFSLVAILIASVGGTLASASLGTSVTNERNRHVYDLFLVRPVKRWVLIVSKYLAALSCLLIAAVLSMVIGGVVDAVAGRFEIGVVRQSLESIVMSVAGMAVASAAGMLFGIIIDTVAVSAILSVYVGNQLASVILLPSLLIANFNTVLFSIAVGILVPVILLLIAIRVFSRKSL